MIDIRSRRAFVREVAALGSSLPLFACAHREEASVPPRIGFFSSIGYPELEAAFREELAQLGYADGSEVIIVPRFSRPNTNDIVTMADELGAMDLALIVVVALPFALEVRRANPSMPMVIGTCPGLVSNGFAESLERPGGIYTGLDELPPGVTAHRLRLLKTVAPDVSRVALLSTTPGTGGHEAQVSDAETAAAELGVQVQPYRASSLDELRRALERIALDDMNGMLNFQGGLSLSNRQLIVDFAAEASIPAVYQATLFAEAGGLMSWAPDLTEQYRVTARYVDQILRGAKPGDLPAKYPEAYYLTINSSAASGLGLTIPDELIAQAIRVVS
jgi:putative ABC transport system substrate-binding protein